MMASAAGFPPPAVGAGAGSASGLPPAAAAAASGTSAAAAAGSVSIHSVHAVAFTCPLCLAAVARRTLAPRLGHLASCALVNSVPLDRARALASVDDAAWSKYVKAQEKAALAAKNKPPASSTTTKAKKTTQRPLTLDAALGSTRAGSGVGTALAHLKRPKAAASTSGSSTNATAGQPTEGRWELDNGIFLLGEHFVIPSPPSNQHSVAQLERMAEAPVVVSASSPADASATPETAATAAASSPSAPSAASASSSASFLSVSSQLYAWRHYVHELDQVVLQMQTRRQWAMVKFRLLQERLESEGGILTDDMRLYAATDVTHDMELDANMTQQAPSSTPAATPSSSSLWSMCSSPLSTLPLAAFLTQLPLQNLRDTMAHAPDTPMPAAASVASSHIPTLPSMHQTTAATSSPWIHQHQTAPSTPVAVAAAPMPAPVANIWAKFSTPIRPPNTSALPPPVTPAAPPSAISLADLPLASSFAQNVLHVGTPAAVAPAEPSPLSSHFTPNASSAAAALPPPISPALLPLSTVAPMDLEAEFAAVATPAAALAHEPEPRLSATSSLPTPSSAHQPLQRLTSSFLAPQHMPQHNTICMAVQVPFVPLPPPQHTPLPLPLPLPMPCPLSPSDEYALTPEADDDPPPSSMPSLERPWTTPAKVEAPYILPELVDDGGDVEMKAADLTTDSICIPETPQSAFVTPLPAENTGPSPIITPVLIAPFVSPARIVHTCASLLEDEHPDRERPSSPPSLNSSQNSQSGLERPVPLHAAPGETPMTDGEPDPQPEEPKQADSNVPAAAKSVRSESPIAAAAAASPLPAPLRTPSAALSSLPRASGLVSARDMIELLSDDDREEKQTAAPSRNASSSSFAHVTKRPRTVVVNSQSDDDEIEITNVRVSPAANTPVASYRPSSSASRVGTPTDTRSIFASGTSPIPAAAAAAPLQWQPSSARKLWADKSAPAAAAAAASPSVLVPVGLPPPAPTIATPVLGAATSPNVAPMPSLLDESARQPAPKRARKEKPSSSDIPVPSAAASPVAPAAASSMSASLSAAASAAAPAAAPSSCPFLIARSPEEFLHTFGACCMPSFDSYSLEELKSLMGKFGLKPKSKGQMAEKLQTLWRQMATKKIAVAIANSPAKPPPAPQAAAIATAAATSSPATPVLAPLIAPSVAAPIAAAAARKPRTKVVAPAPPVPAASTASSSRPSTPIMVAGGARSPSPLMDITQQQSNSAMRVPAVPPAASLDVPLVANKKRKAAPAAPAAVAPLTGNNEAYAAHVLGVPASAAAEAADAASSSSRVMPPELAASIRAFLRSQSDLYLRILMFQPLEIAELAFVLSDVGGIVVSPGMLRGFLDLEGVVTSWKPSDGSRVFSADAHEDADEHAPRKQARSGRKAGGGRAKRARTNKRRG